MTHTPITIKFERTTCGRCGGTGSYSFNPRDGSRCFGCEGSGERLSRAGVAAKKAYDAVIAEMDRTWADVKEGDKVWENVRTFMGTRSRWETVESIKADENNPGRIKVTFNGGFGLITSPEFKIRVWSPEVRMRAAIRVANLKGARVTGLTETPEPVQSPARVVTSATAVNGRIDHTNCDHERTSKARAICRKARG